ncbi:hypothetical protein MLD38_000079 [Melastoma candidum]|uniref:Uncharacterized protein n=1 Tax=Melastoma candidum TaxID=119954 RepID=A0ACB9SDU4_9MYRT|nr:hypothetical protein MLD38_000079 [Melastoma candidum]
MNSIIQTIRQNNLIAKFSSGYSLPLSQPDDHTQPLQPVLWRRLSSASLGIQQQVSSPAASWSAFRCSKSVSSKGDYAGWSWIMSRKPALARDLEMNEEEGRAIGVQNRGS